MRRTGIPGDSVKLEARGPRARASSFAGCFLFVAVVTALFAGCGRVGYDLLPAGSTGLAGTGGKLGAGASSTAGGAGATGVGGSLADAHASGGITDARARDSSLITGGASPFDGSTAGSGGSSLVDGPTRARVAQLCAIRRLRTRRTLPLWLPVERLAPSARALGPHVSWTARLPIVARAR